MKILILGGAGYVGSHFALEAIKFGHECIIYDNLSTGYQTLIPQQCQFVYGDLSEIAKLTHIIQSLRPDAIMHFAASALVEESTLFPERYYNNNTINTFHLLNMICDIDPTIPFVFSSTCAVFGHPASLPIKEFDPKLPISPYGRSKLMCEQIIEDFAKAKKMRAIILRYFNVCGADKLGRSGELHNPETHLIPNIIRAAYNNETITIFGSDFNTPDGTCIRDYISVQDLASAHLKTIELLRQHTSYFDIFHLGYGKGISNLEVVQTIEQAIGKPINRKLGPRRSGDPAALYADISKAQSILKFTPQYSLLEAVKDACRWHNLDRKS